MTDLSSEAAKYLIKVSEDDKLYASYFWWRDFYTTANNDWAEVSSQIKISLFYKSYFPDDVLTMLRPSQQLRPHLSDPRHGTVVENRGQM